MTIGEGYPGSAEDDPRMLFDAFKQTVMLFAMTRRPGGYAHAGALAHAVRRTGTSYIAPPTHYIRVQQAFTQAATGGPRPIPQVILHPWEDASATTSRSRPRVFDAVAEFRAHRIVLAELTGHVWFVDEDEKLCTLFDTEQPGVTTDFELIDWTGGDDGSSGDREPREPFAPIGHLSLEQEF